MSVFQTTGGNEILSSSGLSERTLFLVAQTATISLYYLAYKLVVRALFGTTSDERGWGKPETYICAFVHQVFVAALGIRKIIEHADELEPWLVSGWQIDAAASRPPELLIMLANLAEMITDWLLYTRYRGFGSGYHVHHVLTACGICLFVSCETAPVGLAIAYSSIMEVGGAFLNLAPLFPSQLTYALRLGVYSSSRFLGAAVLILATRMCLQGKIGVPLVSLAPVWLLMLLNLRWVLSMVWAALRRQSCDPWSV